MAPFLSYLKKIITVLLDYAGFNAAIHIAVWLRYESGILPQFVNPYFNHNDFIPLGLAISLFPLGCFYLMGIYREFYLESRSHHFVKVARASGICVLFMIAITGFSDLWAAVNSLEFGIFLTKSRVATALCLFGGYWIFPGMSHFLINTFFRRILLYGIGREKVLIIGASDDAFALLKKIKKSKLTGYEVIGFIDDDGRKRNTMVGDIPVIGTYGALQDTIEKIRIRTVIITKVSSSATEILRIVDYCMPYPVNILLVPELEEIMSEHLKTDNLYGAPLLILLKDHLPQWQADLKRMMDIGISLCVLALGSPLWFFLMFLVKITSEGSAMFKQERVGRGGVLFMVFKFRTMIKDAEKYTGPKWADKDDPRVTRLGKFMRLTRLDEVPQFWNILKGEMSLVGPRPERQFFIDQLKREIHAYASRLKMKPGLTGLAQVKHTYDADMESVKIKLAYDLEYFENMSIWLDLKILFMTPWIVITGKGAR